MNKSQEDSWIHIVSAPSKPERVERGMVDSVLAKGLTRLSVSVLKKNMDEFLSQLRTLLDEGDVADSALMLDEVTVAAQITADGQVAIFGCGTSLQAFNGITLTLRRRK